MESKVWKNANESTALFMGIQGNDNNLVKKVILPNVGVTGEFPKELPQPVAKDCVGCKCAYGLNPFRSSLTLLSLAYVQ